MSRSWLSQNTVAVWTAKLKIRPSASFLQGPFYLQNLDISGGTFNFHDNPLSPSVIDSGAMFIDIDMLHGTRSIQDKEFLFDTGADLTVVSQLTAARLGFDVLTDQPDFVLEVEGAGGVSPGVPGFYIDELNIDTVGGAFTLQNVPVAVLDLPNPNDPANILDGIVGMHLFNGRNLVIDADPAATPGSVGPRLYIGDPVTETHTWTSASPQTNWATPGNWDSPGVPDTMWVAELRNALLPQQFVSVNLADSSVFQLVLGSSEGNNVRLQISNDRTLTTFGETRIEEGGELLLLGGNLDAQFVNIEGGILAGQGNILVGSGPIHGVVRNLRGRIAPGNGIGELSIDGDLSNLTNGILEIQLRGTNPVAEHDRLSVGRFAFLGGTLEIDLVGSFTPSIGQMFSIIAAGEGIVGEFDHLVLPSGFQWNIAYGPNDVVLSVVGVGLTGDYNGDGSVDAADYVVWRKSMGATGAGLPADGNGDQVVDHDDYTMWRSNFGKTSAASSATFAAGVPEPGSAMLLLVGAAAAAKRRRLIPRARCGASMSCGEPCRL